MRVFTTPLLGLLLSFTCSAADKLQVYILAGQSNMQGHASLSTFEDMAADPKTEPLLKEMLGHDGKPRVCERVWISSIGCAGDGWSDIIEQKGKLTAGFGASPEKIGPEFTFGLYIEKLSGKPTLLIKTSWGGRSLNINFRPPSAGKWAPNDFIVKKWEDMKLDVEKETAPKIKESGVFYYHMMDHVKKVLADIKRVVPDYDPEQGYELAGFVWLHGFNDYVDGWVYPNQNKPGGYKQYGELLAHLIRDVRKDLNAPQLPFVIGVMGIGGVKEGKKPPQMNFREAQIAPTLLAEFQGNTVAVQMDQFWDDELEFLQQRLEKFESKMNQEFKKDPKPSKVEQAEARKKAFGEAFTPEEQKRLKGITNGAYHYLGAAKILAPVGKAFAEAVLNLRASMTEKK